MAANEKTLLTIVSALECFPDRPYDNTWSDDEKEDATFTKWALNELLDIVSDHPWTLASDTIENFIIQFLLYEELSELPDQKRIFSIAARAASEILTEIKENDLC